MYIIVRYYVIIRSYYFRPSVCVSEYPFPRILHHVLRIVIAISQLLSATFQTPKILSDSLN